MGICCSCKCCNACQCCTCCGYDKQTVEFKTKNSDWIKHLAKKNPGLRLRDAIIPGTHNSGTYSIPRSKCCSNVAITHSMSIYEQLVFGARFLDIRLGGNGKKREKVNIFHNSMMGTIYKKILEQIVRFCKEYPSELIIIDLIFEYGRKLTDEQKEYIYEITMKKLGEKIVNGDDMNTDFQNEAVTVKDAVDSPKQVILLVDNGLRDFKVEYGNQPNFHQTGYFDRNNYLDNTWHNTNKKEILFEKNLQNVREKENLQEKLINSQMTLTPKADSCKDKLGVVFCKNPIRVDNLTSTMIKGNELEFFMRERAGEKWNLIWFDFLEYTPYLLKYLVGLNYTNYQFNIQKAVIKGKKKKKVVDVTEQAKRLLTMSRTNSFYVVEFEKDFDLKKSKISKGWFTMFYTYWDKDKGESSKVSGLANFEFKKNSKYLLNMMNVEEEGEIFEPGVEVNGMIVEGKNLKMKMGNDEELVKLKKKKRGVLVYKKEENGEVQFELNQIFFPKLI